MILYKIGGFDCKKSSKFEEDSKINIHFLVPPIFHPVALWVCQLLNSIRLIYENISSLILQVFFVNYFQKLKNALLDLYLQHCRQFKSLCLPPKITILNGIKSQSPIKNHILTLISSYSICHRKNIRMSRKIGHFFSISVAAAAFTVSEIYMRQLILNFISIRRKSVKV